MADYGPDQMIPADPEDDLDTEVGEPVAFNRAEQEARLQKAERKLAQLGRLDIVRGYYDYNQFHRNELYEKLK